MGLVGKISAAKCPCGFMGEKYFRAADNWTSTCPDCSKPIHPTGAAPERTYGHRRFTLAGGESMTQGMLPSEVAMARKLMPKSAECIQDSGRVVFPDSKSEQTYRKEFARVRPNPSLD